MRLESMSRATCVVVTQASLLVNGELLRAFSDNTFLSFDRRHTVQEKGYYCCLPGAFMKTPYSQPVCVSRCKCYIVLDGQQPTWRHLYAFVFRYVLSMSTMNYLTSQLNKTTVSDNALKHTQFQKILTYPISRNLRTHPSGNIDRVVTFHIR